MPYTSDQIRQFGDGILSNGGDLQSLLTAAQQYGVPLNDLAGAWGMSGQQGEGYLNSNGFSAAPDGRFTSIGSTGTTFTGGADSTSARNGLQGIVGGDLGSYDGSNSGINDQVLGSALASGRNLGDVMAMFPQFTQQQITDYYTQHQAGINAARDSYMASRGGGGGAPAAAAPPPPPGTGAAGGQLAAGGAHTLTAPTMDGYTRSPYLDSIIADLTTQSNNNLTRNILPGIQQDSVAMGGVGGSKEAIAQGLAIGDSQRSLDGIIGNVLNSDYQSNRARALQKYTSDQGFTLGQGNLDLGNRSLDTNAFLTNKGLDNNYALTTRGQDMGFYTAQRGQDITQAATGASIYDLAQKDGWAPFMAASGALSPFTGLGQTTTGTTSQGGGAVGAVGGAAGTYQLGKNLGWWGN